MPTHCPRARRTSHFLTTTLALIAITVIMAVGAPAQTETTIYNFGTTAPYSPYSGLVLDKAGNLYGVAPYGGTSGKGVVYQLSPVSGGWQVSVIYNFAGGNEGGSPYTSPVFDSAGNLYGTAVGGGSSNSGVVYRLSPTSAGQWQETVLYTFTGGKDGSYPQGNLIFDKAGNLYGSNVAGANVTTTACQNTGGCGVIFKLSPSATGEWKFHLLHTFTGGWDGVGPAGLAFSPEGALFGSAAGAWSGFELPSEPGLVFKLTPVANSPWKDSVVYAFTGGVDGGLPSTPVFDKLGNIYGIGADGGILDNCWSGYGPMGCGVVFEILRTSSNTWQEKALHAFTGGADGSQPDAGLVLNKGKLYGTTWGGGYTGTQSQGLGVVFEMSRDASGNWTETVAHTFVGTDGQIPDSVLVADAAGKLYGTAVGGGTIGFGVAFEITP